jgi:glycerol uptake facilitator-like aquaporin
VRRRRPPPNEQCALSAFAAEALGTAILVAPVVGSGIMAERLAGGNQAVALLGNTIPTGAIPVVTITILGPISGAHFNPAVTLVFAGRGEFPWSEVTPYVVVQCLGGICGTLIAHLMFDLAPLAIGTTSRSGPSQCLTITAAYWFTASTSFANPAVTLARGFTTTFAGIAINHVPAFIAAQLVGAAIGAGVAMALFDVRARSKPDELRGTSARESASPH